MGLFAVFVFDLDLEQMQIAVFMAALPSGINTYIIANYYKIGEKINSGVILLSTMLSFFTLSLVFYIFDFLIKSNSLG